MVDIKGFEARDIVNKFRERTDKGEIRNVDAIDINPRICVPAIVEAKIDGRPLYDAARLGLLLLCLDRVGDDEVCSELARL